MAPTIPIGPVIIKPVADFLVDGRHGLHVTLPPLTAEVLGLNLEEFEYIELHHSLLDFQRPLQDRSRLKHHQHLGGGASEYVNYRYQTQLTQNWVMKITPDST